MNFYGKGFRKSTTTFYYQDKKLFWHNYMNIYDKDIGKTTSARGYYGLIE